MEKYYRILNVSRDVDLSEIKKAYRHAVHLYHPDANGGIGDPEKFKEVVKAYKHLQTHHKSYGIKPRKSFIDTIKGNIQSAIPNKWRQAKSDTQDEAPKRRRTSRRDEFATLDPVLLKLSFKELRLRFCKSDNDYVKRQSARALTYLFGAGAIPLFKQELEICSATVAEEIIYCLGLIGDREAITIIEKYIRHNEIKLSWAAVKALQNIDNGYAKTLLDMIEKEGRAIRHAILHFVETLHVRKLVRNGVIIHSEMYIARYLRAHTHKPMPMILEEMGFVFSK
jgi:hypothetical protein